MRDTSFWSVKLGGLSGYLSLIAYVLYLAHQDAKDGAAPATADAAQNGSVKLEDADAKGQKGSKTKASGMDSQVWLATRVQNHEVTSGRLRHLQQCKG